MEDFGTSAKIVANSLSNGFFRSLKLPGILDIPVRGIDRSKEELLQLPSVPSFEEFRVKPSLPSAINEGLEKEQILGDIMALLPQLRKDGIVNAMLPQILQLISNLVPAIGSSGPRIISYRSGRDFSTKKIRQIEKNSASQLERVDASANSARGLPVINRVRATVDKADGFIRNSLSDAVQNTKRRALTSNHIKQLAPHFRAERRDTEGSSRTFPVVNIDTSGPTKRSIRGEWVFLAEKGD